MATVHTDISNYASCDLQVGGNIVTVLSYLSPTVMYQYLWPTSRLNDVMSNCVPENGGWRLID